MRAGSASPWGIFAALTTSVSVATLRRALKETVRTFGSRQQIARNSEMGGQRIVPI